MKKKILISILAILLLIVILFSLNYLRNYFILKDIYNKNNGYLNNANNFYYKETIHFFATNDIQECEVWYKDGIHLSIFSQNNQKSSLIWENTNTGDFFGGEYLENNSFQEFSKEQFEGYNPKETNTFSKILFVNGINLICLDLYH